jgi:predicted regulator of Ras-like GTPase activity (Roadblock/LC7/MglB family)
MGEPIPESPSLRETIVTGDNESRLRQIFMTDQPFTIERLVALAGDLPGLRGCSITRGSEIVISPRAPSSPDLRALGSRAGDLLAGISSASGLGALPEVTLHAQSGPISIFQRGQLVLVVAHAEKVFLPGVREKLETLLACLEHALR